LVVEKGLRWGGARRFLHVLSLSPKTTKKLSKNFQNYQDVY